MSDLKKRDQDRISSSVAIFIVGLVVILAAFIFAISGDTERGGNASPRTNPTTAPGATKSP